MHAQYHVDLPVLPIVRLSVLAVLGHAIWDVLEHVQQVATPHALMVVWEDATVNAWAAVVNALVVIIHVYRHAKVYVTHHVMLNAPVVAILYANLVALPGVLTTVVPNARVSV